MVFKSTLKALDMSNINQYFDSIVSNHICGNLKDVCSMIKQLSHAQLLQFHYFIDETDHKTASTLKNIIIETVLKPSFQ